MAVSLAVNSEKSKMCGSVSDLNREDALYGVGGSILVRTRELDGEEEDAFEGEERGEHRGVRGYLDRFGVLRQYRIVLSQTCDAASALLPPKYLTKSSKFQSLV